MIKDFFTIRFNILKANTIYTFRNETAYAFNNIASAFSTIFYNIAYLLFIGVLFSNTKNIAGYGYNEILLFYFLCEVATYINGVLNSINTADLIKSVNRGELDLILTKPIPSLFFVSFKHINIVSFIRDCIPPLIIVGALIKWNEFNFSALNIGIAFIIFIIGIICTHAALIIACLPVFWLGESISILNFVNEFWFGAGSTVPLEGMEKIFKQITIFFVPALLTATVTTSILLNKTDPIYWLLVSIIFLVLFLVVERYLWRKALRAYTSASS